MVMGVLEGGKLENLEVEPERVTIVMWENWLLVRRAWRIAVPMLPLAWEVVSYSCSWGPCVWVVEVVLE
jgi:hypothetical protein